MIEVNKNNATDEKRATDKKNATRLGILQGMAGSSGITKKNPVDTVEIIKKNLNLPADVSENDLLEAFQKKMDS